MWKTLEPLWPAIVASIIALLGIAIYYARKNSELMIQNKELQLAEKKNTIDDTAMKNKISAEAQAILQRVFLENNQRMKTMEDDIRHQRDLIDSFESSQSKLEGQKEAIQKQLDDALKQQQENIKAIAAMEPIVRRVKEVEDENVKLRGQIAELRQTVEDASTKADLRHAEMNRITGVNAELETKVRTAEQLLKDCRDQLLLYKPQEVVESKESVNESTEG